jgi:hypothetical protein
MRLDRATPAQLVAALSNDNLFWRLTAQRLLVERGGLDVVPALIALARDQRVDAQGLNSPALHALWTLHGLGALRSDSGALTVARHALTHPAASLRRAALMMLPRTGTLLDDILAAGILPERSSPWTVEYTVPTGTLQDADAHVRLEALLALSELAPSDRAAATIRDVIAYPPNARDPWIPDAVAIAGSKQDVSLLADLVKLRAPSDSLAVLGIQRSVGRIARSQATRRDAAVVVGMIARVPEATAPFAVAMLNGIAEGWPEEQPPSLTPEQRAALRTAAQGASAQLQAAFAKIAARWAMPDLFTPQ